MISCRLLIAFLALVFPFTVRHAISQEAVEGKAAETVEESKPAKSAKAKATGDIFAGKSIQELMTPDEFKAAGLDKLSEDELERLDVWLQGYRQETEKTASEEAEKKASEEVKIATQKLTHASRAKLDQLESRVDGSLGGLTGHTVIKLEDGTVWKQANAEDRFRPRVTDHPSAVVTHGVFGYRMRIEGMPEFYVDPVRTP